jgi:hypothetical protein
MREKINKPIRVPDGGGNLTERILYSINFANQNHNSVVLEFNHHYLIIEPGSDIEGASENWEKMIEKERIERNIRENQAEEDFGTLTIEF